MSVARQRFCQLVLSKLGNTVLWGANGPDAFDCSGLVLWALGGVGAKLADCRAQDLADETPDLVTAPGATPLPGDLCFYGQSANSISHVAVWMMGGRCISADGATSRITDLKTARSKPGCRVRLHDAADFRKDVPYFAIHRNSFLDSLDGVSR
jgi:cell wall-associated NlpC family hydrolase